MKYRNWATGQVMDINGAAGSVVPPGFVPWDEMQSAKDDAARAQQQVDSNKPVYPTIDSWLKDAGGGQFKLADNLTLDPTKSVGYSGIKDIATAAPGTSAWEKMELQRSGLQDSQSRDALARDVAASRALNFSDEAKRGGISRGAMTSIGRNSARDLMTGRQNLGMQSAQNRLGIGIQGEQNRVGALGQIAGYDTDAQKGNISSILTQKRLEDAAKLGKYSEEMKAYASGKTADATAASGKK